MATIKAYTDIEQSKVLAKILPLESADMCWQYQKERWVGEPDYKVFPQFEHATDKRDIPCWSLASLLSILPEYTLQTNTDGTVFVVCESKKPMISDAYDNTVDACVAIIEKLHKLNLL